MGLIATLAMLNPAKAMPMRSPCSFGADHCDSNGNTGQRISACSTKAMLKTFEFLKFFRLNHHSDTAEDTQEEEDVNSQVGDDRRRGERYDNQHTHANQHFHFITAEFIGKIAN